MKRTLHDIRENLDYVGCDNETALELCAEIEWLRKSLLETRNAAAAAMRVIATAPDDDTLSKVFEAELAASGVADGFGVRAGSLLKEYGVGVTKTTQEADGA